jgi:hypothetical protein
VDNERFASDRSRPAGSTLEAVVPGLAPVDGREAKINALDPKMNPAFRFRPGQGMIPEDLLKADPAEFPLPYLLGGPKPASAKKPSPPDTRAADSQTSGKSSPGVKAAQGTAETVKAGSEKSSAAQSTATDPVAVKKPRKPATINPAILEKLLQRNADRVPGQ